MTSPLAVVFLTITLDLIGFGMVVPLLPLYATSLSASAPEVAFLFAGYSLMQFVFAPLWGQLSDRIGRRPVLLTSIAANVGAQVVYALATSYPWLLVARMLAGVCTANIAVASAYIADVTPPSGRARGMGLVGAAFGIGFVIGPLVGGEMSRFGLAAPAWLAAGLSAVNWLSASLFLPESLPPERRRRAGEGAWAARLALLRRGALPWQVLGLSFVQVVGFSMMEMSLVLFAHRRMGLDARGSGRLFGFIGVVLAVVQGGLMGRLARRFGEVRLAQMGLSAVAVGMFAVPAVSPGRVDGLFLALGVMTFGQALVAPALSSLLSQRAASWAQGGALGVGQSLSSLARVVGPEVAGAALARGGEAWPFWLGGAAVAAAAVWAWCGLRPVRVA